PWPSQLSEMFGGSGDGRPTHILLNALKVLSEQRLVARVGVTSLIPEPVNRLTLLDFDLDVEIRRDGYDVLRQQRVFIGELGRRARGDPAALTFVDQDILQRRGRAHARNRDPDALRDTARNEYPAPCLRKCLAVEVD